MSIRLKDNPAIARSIAIFLLLPFLSAAASAPSEKPNSAKVLKFPDSGWTKYQNRQQGYSFSLPNQLEVTFSNRNDLQWSADNRMPFDYVNFRPKDESAGYEPFELGVGVHWNRDNLATRTFADLKDEGLKIGGALIETVLQTEVIIAGIKGVRDDFRIRQPYGWKSYCRIIIPYQDKFFVFLGTLGKDKPVPEYERLYRKIVESFVLE